MNLEFPNTVNFQLQYSWSELKIPHYYVPYVFNNFPLNLCLMKPTIFSALDRQRDTFLDGFAGIRSAVPVDWYLLEEKARRQMTPEAFAYIAGGAGLESTVASNRSAFEKYKIVPRMLRDVSVRDTSIKLFGRSIPSPLLAWLLKI